MGVTIHTPDQTREQIEIGQPKCKCGNAFLVYRHNSVRKKQFLGITALCENVFCENNAPFIAHSEAEMLHTLTCNSNQTCNNMKENQEMRVIIKPSGGYSYGVRNSGGFRCFVPSVHHYTGQDARYEQELEEARRDAYLFAAAQTLLSELEEAHAALCIESTNYIGSERYKRNKAAIEAAKGTQQ